MISSGIQTSIQKPPAIQPRSFTTSAIISDRRNLGIVWTSVEKERLCLWKTRVLSKANTSGTRKDLILNGSIVDHPNNISDLHHENDLLLEKLMGVKDLWQMINEVKGMLASITDGEITTSAYDTAWVALVRNLDGNDKPQFPSSLQWIIDNQLADGSWGDHILFSAHDRMINTLACVIALKSWSLCPEKCDRGLSFLRENMWRLAEEEDELMPIGFEVAFPSLIDIAKSLELQIPYDDPALQDIYAKRDLKLKRIPNEVLHQVPTTLLHSLEGMQGLDWNKLLKLQCMEGSFLFSPSSTAYALAQTGNDKCLQYLQRIVDKFNGGVPNVYPVDLFEHIWIVDRLERLGISRYFEPEIKECMDYVYRYWTEDGICWARNSRVHDVDDTAMGFRMLRLHGYNVSSDVFKNFETDGEFFCFVGQTNQAITGIYNLNRASQIMFPGEEILDRANKFSYRYLREKQAANQLLDKWIITKDLPGEVEHALDFPFYASLPRIETRSFVDQYGGANDVWIGKTLYRMPLVNNDLYLNLAKTDFNQCQAIHQLEWLGLQKWYEECNLGMYAVSKKHVLKAYFLASACIFEPDRATERLGWAKTTILAEAIASRFENESYGEEARKELIYVFQNNSIRSRFGEGLVRPILELIDHLGASIARHLMQPCQEQIRNSLHQAWVDWMLKWRRDEDETGLLLIRTIEFSRGECDPMDQPDSARLAQLASSVCCLLQHHTLRSKSNINGEEILFDGKVESKMQELMRRILQSSDGVTISKQTKQTFMLVAKSFYYAAYCPSSTLNSHLSKVLFQRVE